jgi:hypothetical protein
MRIKLNFYLFKIIVLSQNILHVALWNSLSPSIEFSDCILFYSSF